MSRGIRFGALALGLGLVSAACNCGTTNKCAKVTCTQPGAACDPKDGVCKIVDGGTGGGGGGGGDAGTGCVPDCSGATPICEPISKTCKTCTATQGCSAPTPACDTAANSGAGACVACLDNSHCTSPQVCNTATKTCETPDSGQTCNPPCSGATPICDGTVCKTCTATQGCSAPTPICNTAAGGGAGACVQCLGNTDCAAPNPACNTTTKQCVECTGNADCTDPAKPICNTGMNMCEAAPDGGGGDGGVANDSCATAMALTFSGNTATASGDTSAAANNNTSADNAPSCSSSAASSGKDLVYSFTLTSAQDVEVKVTPGNASYDPVVYVMAPNKCDTTTAAAADELGCTSNLSQSPPIVKMINLQPGTYFVWVDGALSSSGPFTLDVTLSPPTLPPPNDDCSTAIALSFDGGVASASGSNTAANNSNPSSTDPSPSCSSSAKSSGKDVMYEYTLATVRDVRITVTPTGTPAALEPAVYVRKPGACTSTALADQLACEAKFDTTPHVVNFQSQQPGTYSIWIDGTNGTAGTFDILVEQLPATTPPGEDNCTAPPSLAFDGGVATFQVDTSTLTADYVGTCASSGTTGKDAVYKLTLASPQDVTVVSVGGAGVDPVIYLRGATCTTGSELACEDATGSAGSETFTATNLPAGDYFLFVDSWSGPSSGAQTVIVSLTSATPKPANDTCANPLDLFTDGGSSVQLAGNTAGATDDYSASCLSTDTLDVVYRFTTTTTGKLTATVTAVDGGHRPAVFVRPASACLADAGLTADDAGFATIPGCVNGIAYSDPAKLVVSSLPAGTYLLVVDGYRGGSGPFQLTVGLASSDPVPANESCANVAALTLTGGTASIESTTRDAGQDHTGATCSTSSSGAGSSDLVHSFRTPSTGGADGGVNARVAVYSRNSVEYGPAVYLRSSCLSDAGTQIDCSSSSGFPDYHAVALGQGLTPATDYYVWVDTSGTSRKAGPFQLQVDVAGSGSAANDLCSGALQLPANTSVPGSTLGASGDYSSSNAYTGGACFNSLGGAEVVYTFTTTTAGPVTVSVYPQRGFDVGLAVLENNCNAGSCVDSQDPANDSDPEILTFGATANTTYYVFVDSFYAGNDDRSRGGFIITRTP